jgi:hypothetical protein
MTLLLQLIWLATPILASGLVHLVVLKRDWLPALRRAPLDFGATFRGRRVFGANKTWRGAVIMIVGSAVFASLFAWLNASLLHWPVAVEFAQSRPLAWGMLLGLGYILGELPNSFAKRQLDIAPGAMGRGAPGRLFWVVDQLDSLAGILLCVWPVWHPTPGVIAAAVFVMLVLHPVSAWVMVQAGLKDRVG